MPGPVEMSLRKVALGARISPFDLPVFLSKILTTLRSATNSESPAIAMPLGALSLTSFLAPSMNASSVTLPSGSILEMKPLSSASVGLPLMLLTR